jgi:hypothetical protein
MLPGARGPTEQHPRRGWTVHSRRANRRHRAQGNRNSAFGQQIRRLTTSPDADQQQLGEALDMARTALRDAAGRANPAEAERLSNINQGWASLVQVERAALTGKNGVFSPNSYSNAVRATNNTTRRRGYARGEALNQDLADAASEVLPSDIADSGTGSRWASANLPALGIGALEALPYAAARRLTNAGANPSPGMSIDRARATPGRASFGGRLGRTDRGPSQCRFLTASAPVPKQQVSLPA